MLAHIIICPLCQLPLTLEHKLWRCASGHHFDQAREGYLNLLPVQHKKSKAPGDSQDMVDARTRVLESGIYQPISDCLNQWVLTYAQHQENLQIADIGCGEGYYTARLERNLRAHEIPHILYAVDIAKEAIKRAAKRSKSLYWLVASGGRLPLQAQGLDMIINLFTNPMPQGLRQALKPGGQVLIASTGAAHLFELRQRIYDQVHLDSYNPQASMQQHGFSLHQEQFIRYQVELTQPQQIQDLLLMTPHRYKIRPQALAALQQISTLTVSVEVRLQQFALDAKCEDTQP